MLCAQEAMMVSLTRGSLAWVGCPQRLQTRVQVMAAPASVLPAQLTLVLPVGPEHNSINFCPADGTASHPCGARP